MESLEKPIEYEYVIEIRNCMSRALRLMLSYSSSVTVSGIVEPKYQFSVPSLISIMIDRDRQE